MTRVALGFVALALGVTGSSCGSRNLYKRAKFDNPPLERGYAYATRHGAGEAGDAPVEFASPVVTKDTIFVASETRGIEALERATFRRKWAFNVKNGVGSAPALADGVLFFGAGDGRFYALDADFGRILWKYETKAPVVAKPFVDDKRVYLMASDDVVHCLDRETGKWLWHYKRGGTFITTVRGNATPVAHEGVVYSGFSDGYFVALDSKDGNLKWEQKIHKGAKFTDVDATALIDDTRIYVASYDGELYAMTRSNGKVVWHIDVGGSKRALLEDKTLYVGTSAGYVQAVNKDTGRIEWSFQLDQGTPTDLLLRGNHLAFGGSSQYFYAIHKGDGTLAYRYDVGLRSGFFSSPALSGEEIFALSNFGNLYVFRWKTAKAR